VEDAEGKDPNLQATSCQTPSALAACVPEAQGGQRRNASHHHCVVHRKRVGRPIAAQLAHSRFGAGRNRAKTRTTPKKTLEQEKTPDRTKEKPDRIKEKPDRAKNVKKSKKQQKTQKHKITQKLAKKNKRIYRPKKGFLSLP
jgi:hypothetical protein